LANGNWQMETNFVILTFHFFTVFFIVDYHFMRRLSYGIDFGTTNSSLSVVLENGTLKKISLDPHAQNPSVMRSIIYANNSSEFFYGQKAIDAYGRDVREGKGRVKKTMYTGRFITVTGDADVHGVNPDELVEELIEFDEFQGGRMLQSLKSVLAKESITGINLFGVVHPIEMIIGGFLKEMKRKADEELGEEVHSVILGRPVKYVGDNEKLAIDRMKKAATFAGFTNIDFEYEPIGAAYDFSQKSQKPQIVLIFDFGGGTLDISVVKFPENKVLSNVGLPIGGDLFNAMIFGRKLAVFFGSESTYGPNKMFMPSFLYLSLRDWYKATLLKNEKFDEQMEHFRFLSSDEKAIDALWSLVNNNLSFSLYDEIDRVKRNLSDKTQEEFTFIAPSIDIRTTISKIDFEEIIAEEVTAINELIHEALEKAGLQAKDIDAVSTTGGSSLIPLVRSLLIHKFSKEKIIPNDAFTSVAGGLAVKAREVFS
jgi:hypothetical chaperone protein